jgi:hypothetical protein
VGKRVSDLLRASLALTRRERPAAYAAMARELEGMSLAADVDDVVLLRSDGATFHELPSGVRADVRLRTDRATLRGLLDGRATLNESIRSGNLEVAGTTGALVRAMGALETLVCALLTIEGAEELRTDLDEVR